jgi:hypothetical protein
MEHLLQKIVLQHDSIAWYPHLNPWHWDSFWRNIVVPDESQHLVTEVLTYFVVRTEAVEGKEEKPPTEPTSDVLSPAKLTIT